MAVPDSPLPMKMDMQSFQVFQLMLAVFTVNQNIHFKLEHFTYHNIWVISTETTATKITHTIPHFSSFVIFGK